MNAARWQTAHAVSVAGLLLLLALLPAAEQTPDGLSYAVDVRDGADLSHPHHLGFTPAAYVLHRLTGLEALRACLGWGLLHLPLLGWAAWRLARALGAEGVRAWALAIALPGLHGAMFYATHAEVYLPGLAWLALTTALALDDRLRPVALGTSLAMAVLSHQTNVLFVAPLLAAAAGDGQRVRATSLAVAFAGTVVLALYVFAWAAQADGAGFGAWLLSYPRAGVPGWGAWSHFSPEGLTALGFSQARNLVPAPAAVSAAASLATWAAMAGLAGWNCGRLGGRRRLARPRRLALTMLPVYLVFFLWWLPTDPDFLLATTLPLWLLTAAMFQDLQRAGRRAGSNLAVAALALILVAGNLGYTALPRHRVPGERHRLALALDAGSPAAATLVAGYGLQQELAYSAPRRDVREGLLFCRSLARGAPPPPLMVIERQLLTTLLEDASTGSADCLQRIFAWDESARAGRRWEALPGGLGVLVGPGTVEAESWSGFVAALGAAAASRGSGASSAPG